MNVAVERWWCQKTINTQAKQPQRAVDSPFKQTALLNPTASMGVDAQQVNPIQWQVINQQQKS